MIVLADADLETLVGDLAKSAFAFSGQRCTAIRRFIVERSLVQNFENRLCEAILALRSGLPEEETTDIGPLISRQRQAHVQKVVADAVADGARLLTGGAAIAGLEHGCWVEPALIADAGLESAIVQQETFGPVAVIQVADNLDHALGLANAVSQGLLAGMVGGSVTERDHFMASIEAGIVNFGGGPFVPHPDAPFGGWKASGSGLPEHGRWDRDFYTRPKVVYQN
jgi:acyl-CoA reductase-like NAD-dependent aldehyde dehydrogenase